MVPEQIAREIVIDAPVERVWAALTNAEQIRQWFAFDGAEIDLRPGGTLVMSWKEHGTYFGRIERVEPPRLFSYRGAIRPDEQPRDGNSTLIEFSLTPEGTGTRLRVVESGIRDLDVSEEEQARHVAGNTDGWRGAFQSLEEYLQRVAA